VEGFCFSPRAAGLRRNSNYDKPHVILNRLDGFVGENMPNSVAEHICGWWPLPGSSRSEVDRIRARMVALQLNYERKKKVVSVLRQRFGLLTR
jgi:hypothetical protein